jgi:ElaB/YqjD/DUF883 family membrane-anchored ribosome-binding protein
MSSVPPESEMKQNIERISAGLASLLDEAEAILQSTAEGADRTLDAADRKSRATLQRVCGHLRNARSEVAEGAHRIDAAVHAHPWSAMAATAIAGFIAGLLVRRR